jgi:hypothetical protein
MNVICIHVIFEVLTADDVVSLVGIDDILGLSDRPTTEPWGSPQVNAIEQQCELIAFGQPSQPSMM